MNELLVLLMNNRLVNFVNYLSVFFMDHRLMNFTDHFLMNNWLMMFMNDLLMLFMNNFLMMFMYYRNVMLMNQLLMMLLNYRSSSVCLNSGCLSMLNNFCPFDMSLQFLGLVMPYYSRLFSGSLDYGLPCSGWDNSHIRSLDSDLLLCWGCLAL